MTDLFIILSSFFSDPAHYVEIGILIGVYKHEKCLIKINQVLKDHGLKL